jgi:4-amino-4-deoxy-L-arabinose transferase-like glycosyltransferase
VRKINRDSPYFPKIGTVPIYLLLLAAWVALGLFGHDPWKPDEAYTFGLVYHILESGDWVVPTLAGAPFVEKPPLFFWTAAIFSRLFGWALPLHDAARLASAFYVALTLWFTYLAAGRKVAAPLLLAACLGYLQHAHQLITDNSLMAGITIGLYGLSRSSGLLLGTGAGIAFLSKGLLGPGTLALTAVGLLLFKQWRSATFIKTWGWALVAFAPWALVWPWLLYRHSPALFDEWFWVNNFGRFTGEAGLGGVLDHAHYAKALVWFAMPVWPLAAWTLWRFRASTPLIQLPLVAFLVMFIVLSAASSARTLYGLPLLVPLALLACAGLELLPRWLDKPLDALAVWGAGIAGIALWGAWIAFVGGWRPAFLEAQAPGFVPSVRILALVAALAVTALWIYALRLQPRLPVRWLAGVTLLWGLAMTLWLPWLDYAKSYRGVVAEMHALRVQKPGCVATQGLTEPQRAMFHYYAGIRAPSGRDCPWLLIHTGNAQMPAPGDGWRPAWRGTRPGDTKEFFWLFSR